MKTSSPRQLAILISALTALIAGIIIIINLSFEVKWFWFLFFGSLAAIFVVVYFIVYFTLNSFIFEKINPIYKTIYNFNAQEKELRKSLERKDVIDEVNKEVISWANNKTKEIAQLKQLEKYRKEFLGNVSHELKTPIFNIQGYVLTLLDGGLEDANINRLYLERTVKSINRIISIVEDLESISRLESGELKLHHQKFDIITLTEEIFELQEMSAKSMKIKLGFLHNYEKPLMVYADRKRLTEVINNLIVNSIKYGKVGGKTTIAFLDMGENILTEVTDNGIGIAEKDIPRLFERFFRVDKSRSRDMGGTGLGLSIVKHIIEAHNQTINVRSATNVGSSFAFTLQKANVKVPAKI